MTVYAPRMDDGGWGLVLLAMLIGGAVTLWQEHISGWIADRRAYRMPYDQWAATHLRRDEPASAHARSPHRTRRPAAPPAPPYGPPGHQPDPPTRHLWATADTSRSED